MSDTRGPHGPQHYPAIARGSSGAYTPRPSSAGLPMPNRERPSEADHGATNPTHPDMTRSRPAQYNVEFGEAFNRRNSPQRSSDARNHQAGGPSTAAGRYPHGGPLISIHDYEYNHSSTGTGNNGGNGNNSDNSGNGGNNGNGGNSGNGGGTFTAQLVDVDILTRISEQRDFPRGPVPYTVHHSFTQHSQQRDVTPAGPMPSSIHVEKRVGRPNIDPRVWAIDDELKAAWRRHLKGKDKATESDEE